MFTHINSLMKHNLIKAGLYFIIALGLAVIVAYIMVSVPGLQES